MRLPLGSSQSINPLVSVSSNLASLIWEALRAYEAWLAGIAFQPPPGPTIIKKKTLTNFFQAYTIT